MAISLGGEANAKPLPADKELREPVNINDNFRKAKRNSLIWSTVAFLAVFGQPVSRTEGAADLSRVPFYPLGIGFEKWQVVLIGLVIATYMFVGFMRSWHPVELMNSQRFRKRGLEDVPAAMKDLAIELEGARGVLKAHLAKVLKTEADFQVVEARLSTLKNRLASVCAPEISSMRLRIDDIQRFEIASFPGQANTTEQISAAYDELRSQTLALETNLDNLEIALTKEPESIAKQAEKPRPETIDLSTLESTMSALASAADQLTDYHESVDRVDQTYLENFDINLTTVIYIASAFVSSVFLLMQLALPY